MWNRRILKYVAPTILFTAACAFQASAWPDLFGTFAQPPLWLLIIIWLSLYRPGAGTILFLYFLGFVASAYTAIPLKMIFFTILIVHVGISLTRERVFWSGSSYFTLAAVAGVTVSHLCSLVLSRLIEPAPAPWMLWDRTLQILLTIPFSGLIYVVMNAMERPLQVEVAADKEATAP